MDNVVSNTKSIETTKEKEYKKFINFGSLHITDSTFSSNEDNFIEELQKYIDNNFKNSNKYIIDKIYDPKLDKIIDRNEKLEFTKLSSDENHFFGTFTRISTTKDVLTDIIDNKSNTKIDPDSIYFEHNTLFYIDYEKKAISFIKTEHIKNVYPFLETFLNNNNFLNIQIVPLIKSDDELKEAIITQVEISCAKIEVATNTDFVELSNLEKMGCIVKDYKLSVKLEEVKPHFSEKILTFRNKNRENVKRMSISTLNENIDLLTNTYTKSVPIKLNNNYEQNYQIIESTLKLELLKAIQR